MKVDWNFIFYHVLIDDMKRINILELHRMVNEKKEKHNGCYEKVLDMVHNKIKRSA